MPSSSYCRLHDDPSIVAVDTLDLHGQTRDRAVASVTSFLSDVASKHCLDGGGGHGGNGGNGNGRRSNGGGGRGGGGIWVTIITGSGRHSHQGPVLRDAVQSTLDKRFMTYELNPRGKGSFLVQADSGIELHPPPRLKADTKVVTIKGPRSRAGENGYITRVPPAPRAKKAVVPPTAAAAAASAAYEGDDGDAGRLPPHSQRQPQSHCPPPRSQSQPLPRRGSGRGGDASPTPREVAADDQAVAGLKSQSSREYQELGKRRKALDDEEQLVAHALRLSTSASTSTRDDPPSCGARSRQSTEESSLSSSAIPHGPPPAVGGDGGGCGVPPCSGGARTEEDELMEAMRESMQLERMQREAAKKAEEDDEELEAALEAALKESLELQRKQEEAAKKAEEEELKRAVKFSLDVGQAGDPVSAKERELTTKRDMNLAISESLRLERLQREADEAEMKRALESSLLEEPRDGKDSKEEEDFMAALRISMKATKLTEDEIMKIAMGESMSSIDVPADPQVKEALRLSKEETKLSEEDIFELALKESQADEAMFADLEAELGIEDIT